MRVSPDLFSVVTSGIQDTQRNLNISVGQLASGQRVSTPADDPSAFSADIGSLAASVSADTYTASGKAVLSQVQVADSALSSVIGELNQALTLGTQGADGTMNTADRASITDQLRTILSQVISQANSTFNGVALFAGTAAGTAAFVSDASVPNGYAYEGNSGVNSSRIGDNLLVAVNIPGDQIFTNSNGNVLGSLCHLISALDTGASSDIGNALAEISAAINNVSQQRVRYAGAVKQIDAQESFLSQEMISLTSQQQSLVGIDTATAVENVTQAQVAHSSILAAAAKVLPTSLLDYLK